MNPKYTLGLDFGTSSARACILNIDTGEVVSSHANDYSGGQNGIYSDPKNPLVARQSPKDYLETLEKVIKNTLKDFLFRSKLPVSEDKALGESKNFWSMIEEGEKARRI